MRILFEKGRAYPPFEKTPSLELFLTIVDKALNEASERVRQKYGYACSSAMDQLRNIKQRASEFEKKLDSTILVINIT